MAKVRAYIRVAKKGYKYTLSASTKSTEDPIFKPAQYGRGKEALPTVGFAIDLEIPDQLFSKASVLVATINIAAQDAAILTGNVPLQAKKKDK